MSADLRTASDDWLLDHISDGAETLYREAAELPVVRDYLAYSTDDEEALEGARLRLEDLAFNISHTAAYLAAYIQELQMRGVLARELPTLRELQLPSHLIPLHKPSAVESGVDIAPSSRAQRRES